MQHFIQILNSDFRKNPLLFWLLFYIASLAFSNVEVVKGIAVPEIVFLLFFPVLLLSPNARQDFFSLRKPMILDAAVLLYVAAGLVAATNAICEKSFVTAFTNVYFYLVFVVSSLLFANERPQSRRIFMAGFSLASIICVATSAVGMAWSVYTQENSWTAWYYRDYPYFGDMSRARGFLSTPTMMAMLVGTSLLLKLPAYLSSRKSRVFLYLILIDSAGLLMTSSKVMISILAGVVVIFYFKKILSKILTYSILIIMTLLLTVSTHFLFLKTGSAELNPKVTGRLLYQISDYTIYASSYLELKIASAKAIFETFPFGTGPGCHAAFIEKLISKGEFLPEIGPGNPHSSYTGILAEMGLGGMIFLVFFIIMLLFILKKIISGREGKQTDFAIFLYAFFVFFSIEAICSDLMSQRQLWLMLGALAALMNSEK